MPHPRQKYADGHAWSKFFLYQWTSILHPAVDSRFESFDPEGCLPLGRKSHPFVLFAFKALGKLAIFKYGGFEFDAVGGKWQHETVEVEKEWKELALTIEEIMRQRRHQWK